MANGLTSATKEDADIQVRRWERAVAIDRATGTFPNRNYRRQCVGWSIGRGFEADYLEAIHVSDAMRYISWLRWAACLTDVQAGGRPQRSSKARSKGSRQQSRR